MIKNSDKLKFVEKDLVDWLYAFEKDYNYQFTSEGVDIIVTEGLRDIETQRLYFNSGRSQTMNSKHLKNSNGLSQAIDLAFSKNGRIDWNDLKYWKLAGKHFETYMKAKGIKAQWGGSWKTFLDFPHLQLDNTPQPKFITLKLNDSGEMVKQLQTKLNSKGYKLVADGDFGNKTLEAVKDFQSKNKLTVDGIVGVTTWSFL